MKFKTFLIINAAVALIFALGTIFVPAIMNAIFGIQTSAGVQLMTRYFGVSLLGLGLLVWLARDTTESGTRQAIILSMLVSDCAGVVVSLLGTLGAVMSAMGWLVVVIYLLLALGFGYFQFVKPGAG